MPKKKKKIHNIKASTIIKNGENWISGLLWLRTNAVA